MGRIKTPSKLKVLRGTNQPSRMVKMEVVFEELDSPRAPEELGVDGKKEWDRVFPILKSRGLITKPDYQMLLNYCWIVDVMKYIRSQIKHENIIVFETNSQGDQIQKVNKYITAYKDFFAQFTAISARFGFSPADRTKINLPKNPKADDDLEGLIKHG